MNVGHKNYIFANLGIAVILLFFFFKVFQNLINVGPLICLMSPRLINLGPTFIPDYRVFCQHKLPNIMDFFYIYGNFPIQYILYGHFTPMDILPYGHFLIHQICMDISLLWTICHMVFLHIDLGIAMVFTLASIVGLAISEDAK